MEVIKIVSKRVWLGDIETDGLLDECTKAHCFVFTDAKKEHIRIFARLKDLTEEFIKSLNASYNIVWYALEQFGEWLRSGEVSGIGIHNLFGFDAPAMEMLGYISGYDISPEGIDGLDIKLYDTLAMSRTLWPDRPMPAGCPVKVWNPVNKVYNTIGAHGLMAWAYRTAGTKPAVHDWRDQEAWVYLDRCVEDTLNTSDTWGMLLKEATKKAIGAKNGWTDALRLSNQSYFGMCEQERTGVPFRIEEAKKLVVHIDNLMKSIEDFVEPRLPERTLPAGEQLKFPAEPFKGDGEISSYGWGYLRKIGYELEEKAFEKIKFPANPFKGDGGVSAYGAKFMESEGLSTADELRARGEEIAAHNAIQPLSGDLLTQGRLDLENKKTIVLKAAMKLSNQADIKEWLFTAGNWKPQHWGTKNVTVDGNKKARKKDEIAEKLGEYYDKTRESVFKYAIYKELKMNFQTMDRSKAIQKLERKARFLPTTPKFKDQTGQLCTNLEHVEGDLAARIVKWLSMRNRRTTLLPLDEKKTTGWLNHPRLAIDGRLPAGSSGLANTTRQKHRTVVNVPKADPTVLLGREMRALYYAPEGWMFQGVDADALEARVGGWYAWVTGGDGGLYAKKVLAPKGPNEFHTANARDYSNAAGFEITRSKGKNITYGVMYGAGAAKVAAMLGISVVLAQRVIDALWDNNPGLKKCKEKLEKHWEATGKRYIRGIDGRKIYTRSKHSLLNCLFQSTGAIVMDLAGVITREKIAEEGLQDSYQRVIYMHDEYQNLIREDMVEVKKFSTKTLAEAFDDSKMWSGIKEDNNPDHDEEYDGPCTIYYSRAAEISAWAIEEAGKRLGSPVPITGGYDFGMDWSETH